MNGLQSMANRVYEKERELLEKKYGKKKRKIELTFNKEEKELQNKLQLEKETRRREKEAEWQREQVTSNVTRRKDILTAKQDILSKVKQETKEKMKHLDAASFQSFLEAILQKLPAGHDYELVLGEFSSSLISAKWLNQAAPENITVMISNDKITGKSGFILSTEGIHYTYVFEDLVDETWSDVELKLAEELFN